MEMAIKKPDNWENVKAAAEREKLPVGAYICKILKAGVRTYESRDGSSTFEKLEIAFDIACLLYTSTRNGDDNA